jgi:hypothetical protein
MRTELATSQGVEAAGVWCHERKKISMSCIVRDFNIVARFIISKLSTRVTGEIKGGKFTVSVGRNSFDLPVIRCDEDEDGSFAELEPGDMLLEDNLLVRVEKEFDNPPGYEDTTLTIYELADPTPLEQALWRNKINPERVNLLVPPESSLSLCFKYNGAFQWADSGETTGKKPLGKWLDWNNDT